jgi:hypothetical protein
MTSTKLSLNSVVFNFEIKSKSKIKSHEIIYFRKSKKKSKIKLK